MKLVFPSALLAAALVAFTSANRPCNDHGRRAARSIAEEMGCSLGPPGRAGKGYVCGSKCDDLSEAERFCKYFIGERYEFEECAPFTYMGRELEDCGCKDSALAPTWLFPTMQDMCGTRVELIEAGKHQRDRLDPLRRK